MSDKKILVKCGLDIEIVPSFVNLEAELVKQRQINRRLVSLLEGIIIQADNFSKPLADELRETFILIYGEEIE